MLVAAARTICPRSCIHDHVIAWQPRAGPGLPPEQQTDAELAGIASIHPEFEPVSCSEPLESSRLQPGSAEQQSLYDSLLGRATGRPPGDAAEIPRQRSSSLRHGPGLELASSLSGSQNLAESLKDRDGSGHLDIQNLAEHYKGRSRRACTQRYLAYARITLQTLHVRARCRRMAAARELNRAANPEQRAEVILDHQLKDIDSI